MKATGFPVSILKKLEGLRAERTLWAALYFPKRVGIYGPDKIGIFRSQRLWRTDKRIVPN